MKRTFLAAIPAAFAFLLPLDATAQAPAAPAAPTAGAPVALSSAELRSRIQSDKKGIVQRNLPLTDAEAKKFWPLYEKFDKDLAGPQSTINRAVLDYVNAGNNITNANAKRLSEEVLRAQEQEAKLRTAHFARVLKVLPATKAARYMQLENKMRAVINYEIAAAIPLVP
jgi:hypothetical protein